MSLLATFPHMALLPPSPRFPGLAQMVQLSLMLAISEKIRVYSYFSLIGNGGRGEERERGIKKSKLSSISWLSLVEDRSLKLRLGSSGRQREDK